MDVCVSRSITIRICDWITWCMRFRSVGGRASEAGKQCISRVKVMMKRKSKRHFKKMTLTFRHKKYWALVVRMKSIAVADCWPEAHELQWWSCSLVSSLKDLQMTCHLGKANWDFDVQCFFKAGWNVSEVVRSYWKWRFIQENLSSSAYFSSLTWKKNPSLSWYQSLFP